jgi:hypothetical protein
MHVWLSNSRISLAYERRFFTVICDNLIHRRGARRVAERFQCFSALARLPWLDQPRLLEPTRLICEIHEAWDQLWMLRLQDLIVGPVTEPETPVRGADTNPIFRERMFGRYLAEPLHELAVFAASAGEDARVRAGTHRELIIGPQRIQSWRIIHGGRSHTSTGSESDGRNRLDRSQRWEGS